jgi:hypothetical protein
MGINDRLCSKATYSLSSFVFILLPSHTKVDASSTVVHSKCKPISRCTLCILAEPIYPSRLSTNYNNACAGDVPYSSIQQDASWNIIWRELLPPTICPSMKWRERSPPQARITLELYFDGQTFKRNFKWSVSPVHRRSAFDG